MTLLGKIFTVLIMIMSVMFMGVSIIVYATHTNWREKSLALADKVKQTNDVVKELTENLTTQKDRLEREQAARRYSLAALQIRADAYEAEWKNMNEAFKQEQSRAGLDAAALVSAEITKSKLTAEVKVLRDEIRATQKLADDFFANVLILTDGNAQLEGERLRFAEKNAQLIAQVSRLANVLNANGLDENSNVTKVTPDVDGIVTGVVKEMLQISLGFDDGLREGHELDVFRGASYLGRIVIRKVAPSSAVGEIMPKSPKGQQIRKGDRVAKDVG